MEANVIKCPNCGASSTNHTNCEYCGSLLVRFVDKGIDLSTTSYLTNDKVYAGLIDALKQNLERQELSDSAVETGIFYKSSPTVKLSRKRHGVATVFRSGSTTWSDGDPIKLGDKNRGLVIKFSFDIHAEENDVENSKRWVLSRCLRLILEFICGQVVVADFVVRNMPLTLVRMLRVLDD